MHLLVYEPELLFRFVVPGRLPSQAISWMDLGRKLAESAVANMSTRRRSLSVNSQPRGKEM